MKVIIPVAGKGTRLRPHTYTKAKPLIEVAGKPVLGHILDKLECLDNINEIVFITGKDYEKEIMDYVKKNYPNYKISYERQKEKLGTAHAIYQAKNHINEDVLIVYSDGIIEGNFNIIKKTKSDGIIWAEEVENPSAYGVLVLDENKYIKKMVEKPDEPISNLANVGIYYIKNYELLIKEIEYIIEKDMKRKGEYYLTSAFQRMMDKGEKIIVGKVDKWLDCGTIESLLETNQYLLGKNHKIEEKGKNCKIIKPVYIEKGAKLENSTIGPFVSIGKGTEIKDSFIENSIIGLENDISDVKINSSVIGSHVKVSGGEFKKLNIGDHSHIEIRFE